MHLVKNEVLRSQTAARSGAQKKILQCLTEPIKNCIKFWLYRSVVELKHRDSFKRQDVDQIKNEHKRSLLHNFT
jgi:hypothetical protein